MRPRDRRRLQFGLFLWGAGEGLFFYLLPLYVRALGGGATAVGLVVAIQTATAAVVTALAGPITDRFGRRPLIRFSMIVALPGMVIWALAVDWQWLIPGAVLYGASFCGIPAFNSYISSGHDDHVGAFGSIFAFFSLGMIVTPGLGGFVAARFHSFRPVFVFADVLFILSIATIWNIASQPVEPGESLRESARALGANRRLLALCLFLAAMLCAMSMTNSFVSPYLQDIDHLGDAAVGLLASCIPVGEFLMGLALGRINERLGRLPTLLALQVTLGASLVLILTVHAGIALVAAFVLRGSIITAATMLFAFAGNLLPARQQGAGFGLMETAFQAGLMIAAFMGGLLYAGNPSRPFIVSLLLMAALAIVTMLVAPLFDVQPPAATGREARAAR